MQEIQISTLPVTKLDIDTNVQAVINQVKEGEINPLKALIEINAIKDFTSKLGSGILEEAINEYENNYTKGESAHYGATPLIKSLSDKYDFSNDAVYLELKEKEKAIKKAIKEREQLMLIALKSDSVIFDKDGIEVEKPKILKRGGKTLAVYLKES